ncbi:MAG: DNA replication/repair protein RecF, partial [Gammaproteobacteria bacterium]
RCFQSAALKLSPHINVIYGDNGSGKTTILEAAHLLGTGRSFRTSDPDLAIRDGSDEFLIRGTLTHRDGSQLKLGLRRRDGHTTIRLNQQVLKAATELTRLMPVSVVTPDTHVEMLASPKARRRWLDVTLFHVKPGFLDLWKRYMRGIKHRNMLLRRQANDEALEAWDIEISRSGTELHRARLNILSELSAESQRLLNSIFTGSSNGFVFHQGWAAGTELDAALRRSRDTDRQLGSTRIGPHRADIGLVMDEKPIGTRLSRGQLKLWIGALVLAQAAVVAKASGEAPILLVDDLISDLDAFARQRLLGLLGETKSQLLFTTTEAESVPTPEHIPLAVFHVKQGEISRIQ